MSVQTVNRQLSCEELERRNAFLEAGLLEIHRRLRAAVESAVTPEVLQIINRNRQNDTGKQSIEENCNVVARQIDLSANLNLKRKLTMLDCAIVIIALLGCVLGVTLSAVLSPGNNVNLLLSGLTGMVLFPAIPLLFKYKI